LTSAAQGQIADFVRTNEDTFTGTNAVQQIITLTQAQYDDTGFTPNDSYLYIIVG